MGAKGKRKSGGRKKGTPNKKVDGLIEKAARLGVDPFEILLLFAKGDWRGLGYEVPTKTCWTNAGIEYEVDVIPAELRQKSAHDACQYIHPKRKAIEVEAVEDPNKVIHCTLSWADEDDEVPPQNEEKDSSAKTDQ